MHGCPGYRELLSCEVNRGAVMQKRAARNNYMDVAGLAAVSGFRWTWLQAVMVTD